MIRSTLLAGYSELTRSLGGKPKLLLRECGINPRAETDPDSYISFGALCDLLERTAAEVECENFGLRLSQAQGIQSLGPIGFAMQNCSTLRDALDEWGQFQSIHMRGAHAELKSIGGLVYWIYIIDEPGRIGIRQKVDQGLGLGCNVMRGLLGSAWNPSRVHWVHSAPAELDPYRRVFRARMLFGQDINCLAFPLNELSRPLEHSNPDLRRLLERHLMELKAGVAEQLDEQVRKVIRGCLSSQDCSIEEVAAILSVAPRTLQRQLRKRGTSFSKLLEDVRNRSACRHLTESELSLTQLAAILGYSELSAFSRAFHRWHGQSPQAWQRAHGSAHSTATHVAH